MPMRMMQIRCMNVCMFDNFMSMQMTMLSNHIRFMCMIMMSILMVVLVFMGYLIMNMKVYMLFRDSKIRSNKH